MFMHVLKLPSKLFSKLHSLTLHHNHFQSIVPQNFWSRLSIIFTCMTFDYFNSIKNYSPNYKIATKGTTQLQIGHSFRFCFKSQCELWNWMAKMSALLQQRQLKQGWNSQSSVYFPHSLERANCFRIEGLDEARAEISGERCLQAQYFQGEC